MKIRVIDQSGNKQDFEADYAPRIRECFMLTYTTGNATTATNHYFRVKDAMYLVSVPPAPQIVAMNGGAGGFACVSFSFAAYF
jgi:hypothetical protein